jgi:predicted secreted hydrolase
MAMTAQAVTVSGYCELEFGAAGTHCATKVEMIPDPPALARVTQTNSEGYYRFLGVLPGQYTFRYSHVGYVTEVRSSEVTSGVESLPLDVSTEVSLLEAEDSGPEELGGPEGSGEHSEQGILGPSREGPGSRGLPGDEDIIRPAEWNGIVEQQVEVGRTVLPTVVLESKGLCDPGSWMHYSYEVPGTGGIPHGPLEIPDDDGAHDAYPIEWWYANFQLEGEEYDKRYGAFVAYFKPALSPLPPSLVLSAITSVDDGQVYQRADFDLGFWSSDQHLEIYAGLEDRWKNRECTGGFLPFEYHLSSTWLHEGICFLDLDMKALKPPMPVGGDGYVDYGGYGSSYYYSYPLLDVVGEVRVPIGPVGRTEAVRGTGWIDHQWFDVPDTTIRWQWFSIQLEDQREIMVADLYSGDENVASFSNGLNLYGDDCSLEVLETYEIIQTASFHDEESNRTFGTAWTLTEPTRAIDLNIEAVLDEQIIRITPGHFLPLAFWEGTCDVEGTIDGAPVVGKAYVEQTHPRPAGGSQERGPDEADEPGEDLELALRVRSPGGSSSIIEYQLPAAGHVRLDVFNVAGRRVATLVDGSRPAGRHEAGLDASDLASGVYFCRLIAGGGSIDRKAVLIK